MMVEDERRGQEPLQVIPQIPHHASSSFGAE
jgi:hypothetical protein